MKTSNIRGGNATNAKPLAHSNGTSSTNVRSTGPTRTNVQSSGKPIIGVRSSTKKQ